MKAVGVKILKARLSEYLRLIKSGETVLVTERDEVVAELRPAQRQDVSPHDLEGILTSMAEQGRAVLRAEEPSLWEGPSAHVSLKPSVLDRVLNDLRKDDE